MTTHNDKHRAILSAEGVSIDGARKKRDIPVAGGIDASDLLSWMVSALDIENKTPALALLQDALNTAPVIELFGVLTPVVKQIRARFPNPGRDESSSNINISEADLADWFMRFLQMHANNTQNHALITAERALSVVPRPNLECITGLVLEQIRRRLSNYDREPAAEALSAIADLIGMGSAVRTPANIVQSIQNLIERHAGSGPLSTEHEALEAQARAITRGYGQKWESERGEDYVNIGARNDDGELNDFIYVDVSNYTEDEEDDEALGAYLALARPANIIAMFDLIRLQRQRIADLEAAELERVDMPDLAFWVSSNESLNDLAPVEVISGKALAEVEPCQQRMLDEPSSKRYGRVLQLARLLTAERLAEGA